MLRDWWRQFRARYLRFLDPVCMRCGCPPEQHMHYRLGSDCGFHGRDVCWRYR